ncbi:WXG100 family type VII secretion target [Actinocatenispora rupis]|uniref:WXG100 family type VII secretion target n=1 Tax=Actinocatenispora rupis TaxID=519421 RepID=A0A8J3J611_9ACTN|nr:hypothetical protein [Actinocatenispora rupis]GID15450.1 hypothetical protein Aru02nite_63390 [Actinocatenispora rupis]
MTVPNGGASGPMTMTIPEVYHAGVTTIPGYVTQLVDALERIAQALEGLQGTWVGGSQKLADDFTTRWNDCATGLFGTKANPDAGVLVRIADGLAYAALNYGDTELTVQQSFVSFSQELRRALDFPDPNPPAPVASGGYGTDGAPQSPAPLPPITES